MSSEGKEDQNSTPPDVKDEDNSSKAEEPAEADANESLKGSEKESEKSDSEEEEEEEMGLLDRPVEITGSRERKKVQRLELSFATPSKDKHEIPEGSGQKLGECPRIEHQIQKYPFAELKALHKILFNRPGSGNEIKKNIRKFSGFTFSKGSQEYDRKKSLIEKSTTSILKYVCEVLDLERGGTKDELVVRVIEFLMNPKASGKKVPSSKRKSASKGEKKKGQDKKSKGSQKKTKSKKSVSSAEESESAAEDSVHASSSEKEESMSEEEEEKPKKKAKATPKPKASAAKGKKNEKTNEKPKKEDKKPASKAGKRKRGDDSGESSDDDEPLQKKEKSPSASPTMPSDDEIKKLVKKILDAANLQEITMKKVIKQVSDQYPGCDLTAKKDFIKTTVKSVIS